MYKNNTVIHGPKIFMFFKKGCLVALLAELIFLIKLKMLGRDYDVILSELRYFLKKKKTQIFQKTGLDNGVHYITKRKVFNVLAK
jgi:hypothetical protein